MKLQKTILLFLLATIGLAAYSQDIMIFKDGEEVLAKVQEITPDLVKYKLFSNLDGPLISVERAKVFMIKYENGSKQVLDEAPTKPVETPPADPQPTTPSQPTVTYSRVKYERKRVDSGIFNLVKLNPLAVFGGDLPIFYERRIHDQISAEVGLGLTYTYDVWSQLFGLSQDYTGRDPRLGYSARAALHFFPNKYLAAPEEWYFGPELAFRHFATTLSSCGGFVPAESVKESRNLIDFKVTVGYIAFVSDAVLFDFYAGLGMRLRNVNWAECDYTGAVTVIQQPTTVNTWAPAISLGIKFGFGW